MSKKTTKIIYFGTPYFAVPALKSLIEAEYDVIAVVSQPDKTTGRNKEILPGPVKKIALENNIKVLQSQTLKDELFFQEFKELKPDLCIVSAYGKIIPENYLSVPKYGFINIHPSLLPKYRGPSPIQTAIANSDKETGVSIMKIDDQIDHGDILAVESHPLWADGYYPEIEKELAELGAKLLLETLPKYIDGEIRPVPQNDSRATFCEKLERENGRINWSRPARDIYNQIRAYNPEPGTFTVWNNKILNIKKATPDNESRIDENIPAGTVMKIDKKTAVKTGAGYLVLEIIQAEGTKEMDPASFANGHPDFVGSILK